MAKLGTLVTDSMTTKPTVFIVCPFPFAGPSFKIASETAKQDTGGRSKNAPQTEQKLSTCGLKVVVLG